MSLYISYIYIFIYIIYIVTFLQTLKQCLATISQKDSITATIEGKVWISKNILKVGMLYATVDYVRILL